MENQENKKPEDSKVVAFNPSKRKLAKQIGTVNEEISDIEKKMGFINNILMKLIQENSSLVSKINEQSGILADLVARQTVLLEKFNIKEDVFSKEVEAFKIKKSDEDANNENEKMGYEEKNDYVIDENCLITITTKIKDQSEDKGILRSRINLSDPSYNLIKSYFIGKKVGDMVDITIGQDTHIVEILKVCVKKTENSKN